jgi:3-oxoacyl-[acyl-carrier protein] reductase
MDLQLRNKTALVTGASVGIGRGIALALAAEGVKLAITARRAEKLEELAAEIESAGGTRPVLITQDMYAEDASRNLAAAAIDGLGHVDILVNNAGGSRSFKDLHVSEEQWQEAITLNFHRPRQLGDALIDQMIARRWGRIINITGKSEPEHINGAFCAKAGTRASGLAAPSRCGLSCPSRRAAPARSSPARSRPN